MCSIELSVLTLSRVLKGSKVDFLVKGVFSPISPCLGIVGLLVTLSLLALVAPGQSYVRKVAHLTSCDLSKLSVCLFYLGKSFMDLRVQFNAIQSSTSKFSLIRNINTKSIVRPNNRLPRLATSFQPEM